MALDLDRPTCNTDDSAVLVEAFNGTQLKLRCEQYGHGWLRGDSARQRVLESHPEFFSFDLAAAGSLTPPADRTRAEIAKVG